MMGKSALGGGNSQWAGLGLGAYWTGLESRKEGQVVKWQGREPGVGDEGKGGGLPLDPAGVCGGKLLRALKREVT